MIPKEILEGVRSAVADRGLHAAVSLSVDRHSEAYEQALTEETKRIYRLRARDARLRGVRRLGELAERFIERAEAHGIRVHTAASGEEAVQMVASIVRAHGARRVVKSKSMATEEIRLNERLEQDGVRVVETDLGEYIVQLAKERPSHILAPCLHKTRAEIAELFSREAGRPIGTQTRELTQFARERLRGEFQSADLGISGANLLVADEGAIVVVSNEGNARMCTSVPKVHVAVAAVEKLIGSFGDAADVLRILPVAATGQAITSYVSVLRRPALAGEDGPREVHVVLMDGGRSEILGGAQEEALLCIRCGACLDVCPVYRQTGGHAYGSVYSGPIGAVLTPLVRADAAAQALPLLSSLCGACTQVCPVGIHLHEHLLALRARGVARGVSFPGEAALFRQYRRAWGSPGRYRLARHVLPGALRLAEGAIVGRWRRGRTLPRAQSPGVRSRLEREGLIEGADA